MIEIVSMLAVSVTIVLLALVFYALFRLLRVDEESTKFKNGTSLEEYKEEMATPSQKGISKFRQFLLIFVPLPILMRLVGNSFLCILTLIVVFFISIYVISNRVRTLLTTFDEEYVNPSSWENLKERKGFWRVRKRRLWRWDIRHYEITRESQDFSDFKQRVKRAQDIRHHAYKRHLGSL